ncbi:uncharacterized protein Fot_03974 [Forsythia ovata]|uniref:GCK domain-containing protein n=1 Tax=Forsythia ovata TaxID=205694 RepID=A0ABD1XF91_9LAMI
MSSSNSPRTHEPKPETQPIHQPESPEIKEKETVREEVSEESINEGDRNEEEEEEGECGFCLFMKGGGCKDTFIEWEKCIEEGEKNKQDIHVFEIDAFSLTQTECDDGVELTIAAVELVEDNSSGTTAITYRHGNSLIQSMLLFLLKQ